MGVFPAGGVNALAGLHSPQTAHPVAWLSAARAGEKPRRYINPGVSPGCGVNALPGLQPADRTPRSPAKRGASRGETASIYKSRGIPGLRRKRLTRATARRPHTPVARLSAARAGEKPRRYINPGISPGCGVNALPGLPPANRTPRSLAKRSASRGKTASMYKSWSIPGLRRKRLTRATARRLHNPVAHRLRVFISQIPAAADRA